MREPDDWRLKHHKPHLKGVALSWSPYAPANPKNDHDHCEFCFAKFMVADLPGVLHEGYTTADRYYWICVPCFDDFADLFEWQVGQRAPQLD
jgi:hypothetical protein